MSRAKCVLRLDLSNLNEAVSRFGIIFPDDLHYCWKLHTPYVGTDVPINTSNQELDFITAGVYGHTAHVGGKNSSDHLFVEIRLDKATIDALSGDESLANMFLDSMLESGWIENI